jgi:hypothetical protein
MEVKANLRGAPGMGIPVLRLSEGGLLEDFLVISTDKVKNEVLAASPEILDGASFWNYIIKHGEDVFMVNSIDLEFKREG